MSLVLRLVAAYLRHERWRLLTTTVAIVAAALVVVWVVAGYDALSEQAQANPREYLGRADLVVVSRSSAPFEDAALRGALLADAEVLAVEPVRQVRVGFGRPGQGVEQPPAIDEAWEDDGGYARESAYIDGDGSARPQRPGGAAAALPVVVASEAEEAPREPVTGRWLGDDADGCVLSADAAERHGLTVGDSVLVQAAGREAVTLAVVGIVPPRGAAELLGETLADAEGAGAPAFGAGPAGQAVFVRPAVLAAVLGQTVGPNVFELVLGPGADIPAFRARWAEPVEEAGGALLGIAEVERALGQSASAAAARMQSYAATAVALLASLFIIFSTLSMGVTERTRQLAVLRAVGLTRGQLAGLVCGEALALATLGWLGGLGAGGALLGAAAAAQPGLALNLGGAAIALSALCAFAGALAAAVLPAWAASRVDIVRALSARPAVRAARWLRRATVVGLLLLAVSPITLLALPLEGNSLATAWGAVGLPSLLFGFLFLAPAFVVGVERVGGRALAALLGLPHQLLRSQLSSHLPRTVGVTLALSVGLGLFISIQLWGYTMLGPFLPGDWAPQAMVMFTAGHVPGEAAEELAALPAIERVGRLATEQPLLAEDLTGAREKGQSVTRQDNVVLLGVDPADLEGGRPLVDLQYVVGTREEVIARLAEGGRCVIPDHFARETGLGIGDSFAMIPPFAPDVAVRYEVAGIVNLPGWHFVTKESGLRRRLPRAAALIFTRREDLERDFELDPARSELLGFQLAPGTTPEALRAALAPLADAHAARHEPGSGLQIMMPGEVRASLQTRTDTILWAVSELPLITLLVTALAVMNAVLASIRARRWELGVLRAVGVTRGGLVRMVVAEAALVGVVACALSISFGVAASWAGLEVTQHISFFGGLAPPLVIPWAHLALGVGLTLVLCLLAGIWPALAIGRTDTLALLRSGRAAM